MIDDTVDEARARFLSRVIPRSGTACWHWIGAKRTNGYGVARFGGRLQPAHRVAWQLWRGEIPAGSFVLHRCDNRPCVNVRHLFLGSQADNIHDMDAKGRRRNGPRPKQLGEANWKARLTTRQVADIRAMGIAGYHHREIAEPYGVCVATIGCILRGETWPGVEASAVMPSVTRRRYSAVLSASIARDIRASYTGRLGELTRLALEYGVSLPSVRAILDGRSYPEQRH